MSPGEHTFIDAGAPFSPKLGGPSAYAGLVATSNFDAAGYLGEFERRCNQMVPVGAYRFRSVDVTDSWMLVSSENYSRVHSSMIGMGWSPDHIKTILDGTTVKAVASGQLQRKELAGKAVLVSFPGAFTYGHVLVDISIRLQMAKAMHLLSDAKVLLQGPFPAWALPLLSVLGISLDDCIQISNGECYQVEDLYVPTLTGVNGVLHHGLASLTFRRMKETIGNILGPPLKQNPIIFPLHTTMSSVAHARGVMHRDEIAATMQTRFGAQVFDPLELTFAQQVDQFRSARLVIGECSSALHNILWSEAADVAVMAPNGRANFYHIGIQAINGGRCAIQWGDIVDARNSVFQIDLDSFSRTIEQVLRS